MGGDEIGEGREKKINTETEHEMPEELKRKSKVWIEINKKDNNTDGPEGKA